MKNNKKGFTLIELLAVIVILAIIMVIAVPQILNVINSSKESAWDNNVKMIKRAIETHESIVSMDKSSGSSVTTEAGCSEANIRAIVDIADDTTVTPTFENNICTITLSGTSGKQFAGQTPQTIRYPKSSSSSIPEVAPVTITNYAFGDVTTSSPTTAPSGKNVYVALYSDNTKAVCIKRNGTEHCFKANNFAVEQDHLQQVFSDVGSYDESTGLGCGVDSNGNVSCNASDFFCLVYSNGSVSCRDYGVGSLCSVSSGGSVYCN